MLEFILWFISFVSLFVSLVWFTTFYLSKADFSDEKKINELPKVTICVPAYNEEKTIIKTLNSLSNLNYPKEMLEIIVVDDGSIDKTYDNVKKFIEKKGIKNIILIKQNNKGKANALNNALKISSGDLFGCVDADSTVSEDSLKKIVRHFTDDKVGAVVSTIQVQEEKNFLQKLQKFEYILSSFFRKLFTSMESQYITPGVLSVYKKSAIVKLNGFDEDNITEDLEMGLRLNYHKYKIFVEIESKTRTEVPATIKTFWRQRVRWLRGHIQNLLKYKEMFFNREYGFLGLFQLPLHILSPVLMILSATIISYGFIDRLYWFFIRMSVAPLSIFDYYLPTTREIVLGAKFPIIFPLFIIIFIGLFIHNQAHKYLKEKWTFPFVFIVFLTIYPLIISYFWIVAITEEIFGSEKRWR